MKAKEIKVLSSPESTSLARCKAVLGANALCTCKDICVNQVSDGVED